MLDFLIFLMDQEDTVMQTRLWSRLLDYPLTLTILELSIMQCSIGHRRKLKRFEVIQCIKHNIV